MQPMPDRLDSLLHIAGIVDLGPIAELRPKTWHQQLNANLISPAELTRLFLPQLRAAQGHVLFVNSGAGLNAHAEWGAYAASKHGLKALADSLREEEHGNGVRVTSVYPGRTASPMQAKVHSQEGKEYDASRWIDPGVGRDDDPDGARPAARRRDQRPDGAAGDDEARLPLGLPPPASGPCPAVTPARPRRPSPGPSRTSRTCPSCPPAGPAPT